MSAMLMALGVDKMTVEDRIRLIGEIWDTIPNVDDIPLTEAQMVELERRLELHKANPKAGSPVEEVMARLRSAPV